MLYFVYVQTTERAVLYVAVDSRIGRQPNALKHATFLQLCRIKTLKGITSSTEPFALLETKPDFVEPDGSDSTHNSANISPDHTVTTTHDGHRMLTDGQKRGRRPHRRRTAKVTTGISDSSTSVHHVDSTQSRLSPIEIKQETLSPVECQVGELLDQLGVELVQDFAGGGQQQLAKNRPECGTQSIRNTDIVETGGGYPESEPTDGFQASAGTSPDPRPDLCVNVQNRDHINTVVPTPATLSQAVQSDCEQVVRSMQRAVYDLLSILHRVCYALLTV